MYASKIVEYAETEELFRSPRHPYTFGLLESLPEMHHGANARLKEIPGTVPNPLNFPSGCKFRTRCFNVKAVCESEEPPLVEDTSGHLLACHNPVSGKALAQVREQLDRAARRSALQGGPR
jgi:oligopeptide/dipeptide ABC transporter ATP-binding protein